MRYQRRPARRQLADRADQRSRRRQVRRRLAGAEFREPESRRTRCGPSSTISIPRSTPRRARYLEFERWWGGHVNLNAEEIQFIVDELFVGNKLARRPDQDVRRHERSTCATSARRSSCSAPRATTSRRRSRRSDWILDLYDDVDDIRAYGQTIVYTVHESVGHLGIFVSGGVARKEHDEFSSNIDLIDVLPPGLYEATFEAQAADTRSADLVVGRLGHALRGADARRYPRPRRQCAEDERRFATAATRVRDQSRRSTGPSCSRWSAPWCTPQVAEWMQQAASAAAALRALRATPIPSWRRSSAAGGEVRERSPDPRRPTIPSSAAGSGVRQIVACPRCLARRAGQLGETDVPWVYGSPVLQAAVGIDPAGQAVAQAGKIGCTGAVEARSPS